MSTIGYSNWAVDLAEVSAVYPFHGGSIAGVSSEVIMVVIGVAFWLLWHVCQLKEEQEEIDYEVNHENRDENIRQSLERY